MSINRRDFLKGAVTMGALAGAGSLAACAPQGGADDSPTAVTTKARSWETVPDPIPENDISETVEADVVIIGAGVAGMTAFMHACEAGAKAVIIEKMSQPSARGLDMAAVNTRVQKAAGVSIDKGQLVSDLVKASGYKANGSLIKLWADKSGEVFDRIIDLAADHDAEFVLGMGSSATANAPDFTTRTYPTDHNLAGYGVHECMEALVGWMQERALANGGASYYKTRAEQLLKDGSGNIIGVVASQGSSYVKYTASKGVILATGDYGGNEDMVAEWCPLVGRVHGTAYIPPEANTGDGINMALWAGASMQPGNHGPMVHPIQGGGALCTASFLRVNANGKRFADENTTLPGITDAVMSSAKRTVWTIFDADYESQMASMSALSTYNFNTAGSLTKYFMDGSMTPDAVPPLPEIVQMGIDEGATFEGQTLEELATTIDVPADALVATVARYNELVDLGVDEDFGKDPACLKPIAKAPFYASQVPAKLLVIPGGLNVDDQLRVLDSEERPIEGLFACGNVQGNFFANDYPICAPGLSHGRCITLGALLGAAVAKGSLVQ